MTVGTASFTAAKDSSSPAYAIAAAGTSGLTAGVLKFAATNDAITLNRVALQLTNTSTSSATDLTKVYLYDGATKVGESLFTGSATTTAVTVSGVTIPKDGSKVLTIKVDAASMDATNASTLEGAFIAVDLDGDGQAGSTYGTSSSGASVTPTLTDTAVAGFRVFKSYPTFARIAVPSSTLVAGTMDLYRFSVTASPSTGNGIGIQTFTVQPITLL
ncbi:MAG: hypothetical protein HY773_00385 [Candidatus Terrybacteria bacterium]|nr:hypothetical protein [Candidatus Terrybacteria bacterium]